MRAPEPVILLPEIDSFERRPDGLNLQFVVPADLGYFAGHFPGVPLLPGVVQIGWAVELARQHVPFDAQFRALAGVKFMRVIQPGATVALQLAFDAAARELSFEYRCGGQPCSGGRALFQ
ncbi:MAG TPA: hypothetical protein PKE27_09425 [Povalibacter sp.]|uniref:ApeI family dehydratase n=1 Tax=Povalibacter sp. TaxID=1962978 RepID=UPI002C2CB34F|nr:hypothetical protein [Povalibacter sp.]HMN44781.1 hypothetical protein [Povalibacter sp.]